MKTFRYFAPIALALAFTDLAGQQARVYTATTVDEDRPRIGVSTGPSGKRDTLGLLVTSVTRGGPAEKAGIEEGDRLVSVNNVSLRLAAADIEDYEMTGVGTRRLMRELGKAKAGDKVSLRVYREGQTREVSVTTVTADDLQPSRVATVTSTRRDMEDRAALGIGLGGSGSRRDTIGILVSSVTDDGPADKARVEEGDRIAAINGVDLRVSAADAGDYAVASSRMRRLTRELEKVKAGDEVELRLVRSGQSRTVRVKTVAAKDLPRSGGISIGGDGFFFNGGEGFQFNMPRGALMLPRGEGQRMFEFNQDDGGSLRMRLSPERRADVERRLEDLRGRFERAPLIIRPRGQWQSNDEWEALEGRKLKAESLYDEDALPRELNKSESYKYEDDTALEKGLKMKSDALKKAEPASKAKTSRAIVM